MNLMVVLNKYVKYLKIALSTVLVAVFCFSVDKAQEKFLHLGKIDKTTIDTKKKAKESQRQPISETPPSPKVIYYINTLNITEDQEESLLLPRFRNIQRKLQDTEVRRIRKRIFDLMEDKDYQNCHVFSLLQNKSGTYDIKYLCPNNLDNDIWQVHSRLKDFGESPSAFSERCIKDSLDACEKLMLNHKQGLHN